MSAPDPAATAAPDDEPVGSVAEEAFKLFRAMSPPATEPQASSASEHACSTAWCPVCHVAGFVRDHPDAVASVTQSATVFARSLRDLVDTALHAPQEKQ